MVLVLSLAAVALLMSPILDRDQDEDPGRSLDPLVSEARLADTDVDLEARYVDPVDGDDGREGTSPDLAWRSLATALTRVEPGQTLFLMDGEYTEQADATSHYHLTRSGTADDWIRIAAMPDHRPILVATEATALTVEGNYIEVAGLRVEGRGFSADGPPAVGLAVENAHHVQLMGNQVSGMPQAGIAAVGSSKLWIEGNEVFDNGQLGRSGGGIVILEPTDHGQEPAVDGFHDRIVANIVYGNERRAGAEPAQTGNGILIDHGGSPSVGRTLIANNLLVDNAGPGVQVSQATFVDIVHNTFFQNGRTADGGVEAAPFRTELSFVDVGQVLVLNNLAWTRPGQPGLQTTGPGEITRAGNLFVEVEDGAGGLVSGAGPDDVSTAVPPPLINPSIDVAGADFRPQPGAARLGDPKAGPVRVDRDADGNRRPAASETDAGAYQGQD